MKTTYIYYPGLSIAFIILILNIFNLANIDYLWIFVSLFLGWVGITENSKSQIISNNKYSLSHPNDLSDVIWFPLIRKFLKKIL